jgi:hypothetical protein
MEGLKSPDRSTGAFEKGLGESKTAWPNVDFG